MGVETGEGQPPRQPVPYTYVDLAERMPELEEYSLTAHLDDKLGSAVVLLGEAALNHDDHEAYEQWGNYLETLVERMRQSSSSAEAGLFYLADFYISGMLRGDLYATGRFDEALAALRQRQVMQLYGEREIEPHIWINENIESVDDRAEVWEDYYDQLQMEKIEKGEDPDTVPVPQAMRELTQPFLDRELSPETRLTVAYLLIQVIQDPVAKRNMVEVFEETVDALDEAGELDDDVLGSVFQYGEFYLADVDFELADKEGFVGRMGELVRERVGDTPMLLQDFAKLQIGLHQANSEPIERIAEEIETTARLLEDPTVREDLAKHAIRICLRQGELERTADLLTYVHDTETWLTVAANFARQGADPERLRPDAFMQITDPERLPLFTLIKALKDQDTGLAADTVLDIVGEAPGRDEKTAKTMTRLAITPQTATFLRNSLANLIEQDKPRGWEVCRTVIDRLHAHYRVWFAPELFKLLVDTGAENGIRDWLEYTQPEHFQDRILYFNKYAELAKAASEKAHGTA